MSSKEISLLYKRSEIHSYLKENKLKEATPVQAKVAPLFKDQDLSVLAPTGSGKTLSFSLPLIEALKDVEDHRGAVVQVAAPRALVLTPTRELSRQVFQVLKEITHHAKCRVRLLAQGQGLKKEAALLKECFDLLVCSPGRLSLMLANGSISLEQIEYLVLDEADQMLDMGFYKDLKSIFSYLPKERSARVHLFTATRPSDFSERIEGIFGNRKFHNLILDQAHKLSAKVETYNIYLSVKEKTAMLETFLKKEAKGAGVVFVNDKADAQKLYQYLTEELGKKDVSILHGEMTAQKRRQSHQGFQKKGGLLIATDIAARGIDLPQLAWVLNYDLPYDPVYYIHRSGRVGRLGKVGLVYNFVTSSDVQLIDKINQAIMGQTAIKLGKLKSPFQNKSKKVHKKVAKKTPPAKKGHKKQTRSFSKKSKPSKKATSKNWKSKRR